MEPSPFGETRRSHTVLLEGGSDAFDEVCNHTPLKSIFGYARQVAFSYRDVPVNLYSGLMERTPDERREILRQFINERPLKIARWAKESGVDKNSIYNFLNGHSQALDLRTYAKLARTAEVPIHRLTGDMPEPTSPVPIWVVGYVEAGEFREAVEWDRSRWYEVDVPVPDRFRRMAKALEIRGTSMNVEYPPGSVAIWVDVLDSRPARHEDHVVVYAYTPEGKIEATVKELRLDGTTRWLWPRSTDPQHQTPINIDTPPEGIKTIEIKGLVIGGYKPRVL